MDHSGMENSVKPVSSGTNRTGLPGEKLIAFYIELFEEESAYYMAARLQQEKWEVNVMPSGGAWMCLAHAMVKPDSSTISDLCDYLSDLSEFYGGVFQSWELD